MLARAAAVVTALAALTGCSRDLAVPPKPSVAALGIVPAFQSAAPRQPLQFAGTGGVPPYTFGFAQGGRLSGDDATLSPGGAYVAGSIGSAQDVIEVTDSRGVTMTATVSVGQRVAITPAFTGTVPGGRVAFQATGGNGSYLFSAGTSGSGGDVTLRGAYTAGATGDTVDTVIVTDTNGGTAQAEVQVGPRLQLYRSETRPVAPHEAVTFIAFGGKPPYRFAIGPGPGSGNPGIDPASGAYVAGDRVSDPDPDAVTTDVVTVTDSADVPQTATLFVAVGARLRLALDTAEVFPGRTAQLVATGGKPPYTFGFAARIAASATGAGADPLRQHGGNGGNRSHGTISALTGEYVPGFSPGAVDYLQVTDATGGNAAVLAAPRVGSLPIAVGSGVRGCVVGDLNGDGSQDFILTETGDGSRKIVAGLLLDSVEPWIQGYFVPLGGAPMFAGDFSGAGRASVTALGGDRRCSGGYCPAGDFWALQPDLVGYLSAPALQGGGAQQFVTVPNDPPYQNGSGTAYHQVTTNWGVRTGAGRQDASGGWQFWGPGMDSDTIQTTVWSPGPQACSDPTFQWNVDAWLMRMDWPAGAAAPSRPTCVKVSGYCPGCTGGGNQNAVAMAVGDFDGDGRLDLAWILGTDSSNRYAAGSGGALVRIAYGDGAGNFTVAPVSGWPSAGGPWAFQVPDGGTYQGRFQVVRPPGATRDGLLVRLQNESTGRGRLHLARAPRTGLSWVASLDPNPSGAGPGGFVESRGAAGTSYYAWSGDDGVVSSFSLDPVAGFTTVSTAGTLPFAVNQVCLPDANADGIPDLLAASDVGATAHLVLGDGAFGATSAGTFGHIVRQRGVAFPVVTGDFDGDGFVDALVANGSGAGVSVLWGGGGMLAWGAQVSSAAMTMGAGGDYDWSGGHAPGMLYLEKSGRFGILRSRGDGTFDPGLALTGWAATGGPVESAFYAWPADLNTASPGIDAMTFGQKGSGMQPRALLVQATQGRVLDVVAKPIPAMDGLRNRTEDCWTLPVGRKADLPAGTAAVALVCSYSTSNGGSTGTPSGIAVWGATITNVDHGPAPGDATPPAFTDWVLVVSTSSGLDPAYVTTNGGRLRVAMVGTRDLSAAQGGQDGTAIFAFASDALYMLEVQANGQPANPAAWTARPLFKVAGPDTAGFYPFLANAGAMAPPGSDALFHAVVAGGSPSGGIGGGGSAILKRTTTGWTMVQRLGTSGFPVGIGPVSSASHRTGGADAIGDVVMFVGDWGNTGLVPELTLLLNANDGTGSVR